ncbi:MAG: N-acetylglucosamine-6-phosphate deacetylase [Candidatus Bipolaricaulia bacterium]
MTTLETAPRRIAIVGGHCILPDERELETDVLVIEDRITRVGSVEPAPADLVIDAVGCRVVPGFIDLHVHGGAGVDFADGSLHAVEAALEFHAAHGTTRAVASLIPMESARLRQAMATLADRPSRGLLGVHLEGPYVSPTKRGGLDRAFLRPPDGIGFRELVGGFENSVRIVTLAPELPGATGLLEAVRDVGAIAAIGHSEATYEQALAAIGQGVRHVTHWGNAMSGLHHRAPGILGAALFDARVTLEVIADGIHVHPDVIRFLIEDLSARGQLDRLCLVTDAIRAAGSADGRFTLGNLTGTAYDGVARLADGTLAGSTLTLDAALRNVVHFSGIPLPRAIQLVTRNPAAVLGETHLGQLRPGAVADIVLLDEALGVRTTIRSGKVLFNSSAPA